MPTGIVGQYSATLQASSVPNIAEEVYPCKACRHATSGLVISSLSVGLNVSPYKIVLIQVNHEHFLPDTAAPATLIDDCKQSRVIRYLNVKLKNVPHI